MIRIVVDSTCDLPEELYRQHDITVVPINVLFGMESYRDGVDIDRATFLRKIEETGILPQTSQPSAGQFEEYYSRLADAGATNIVSLLAIKPIVLLENGLLDVAEQVRTRRRAITRMIEFMVERIATSALVNLAAVHTEAPDEGRPLLEQARAQFNCQETFLCNLTTSLVVHFGPGTLGLIV